MEFWSWTIAVILGLSAILSPIVTSIINNHYQNKRDNIKNYQLAKRQALVDFIKATTDYQRYNAVNIASSYYSSQNTLYVYFDIPNPSLFYNLEDCLKNGNIISSNHELTNIVVFLQRQIKKQ